MPDFFHENHEFRQDFLGFGAIFCSTDPIDGLPLAATLLESIPDIDPTDSRNVIDARGVVATTPLYLIQNQDCGRRKI